MEEVVEISYGRTVNKGNYNSEKLEFRKTVPKGDPRQVLAEVRTFVCEQLGISNEYTDDDEEYLTPKKKPVRKKKPVSYADTLEVPEEDEDWL